MTKSIKVIFDTNVWISYLIGKRLSGLTDYISSGKVTIVLTDQLLTEIREVTQRPRLTKYFPQKSVSDLLDLLGMIALHIEITPTHFDSRDPKDNFLLDLIEYSKADFLVTGDQDLLVLNPFGTTQILSPVEFENTLKLS